MSNLINDSWNGIKRGWEESKGFAHDIKQHGKNIYYKGENTVLDIAAEFGIQLRSLESEKNILQNFRRFLQDLDDDIASINSVMEKDGLKVNNIVKIKGNTSIPDSSYTDKIHTAQIHNIISLCNNEIANKDRNINYCKGRIKNG